MQIVSEITMTQITGRALVQI